MQSKQKEIRIETFEDILRALRERPDWLEELRKIILTEELLALPQKFENFLTKEFNPLKQDVEILKQDVAILKQDVAILKQDVAILKQDVEILKQDVEILKQDVAILKQDVEILKQDVAILKQEVAVLKQEVAGLKTDVASLKGDNFERKVREKLASYLGKVIRGCKLIEHLELAEMLDNAIDQGVITEDERYEALRTDIVCHGRLRRGESREVVLAVEVSIKVDRNDVERAYKRAMVIGKVVGAFGIGTVVGTELTEGAQRLAEELGVIVC